MKYSNKACIAGVYEHPTRHAPHTSVTQLHIESAIGALADAGLSLSDVDAYFCAGDAPGGSPFSLVNYLNLKLRWIDGTDLGGCSYMVHVRHAAAAIEAGKCSVALITLAGKPRSAGMATGSMQRVYGPDRPESMWEPTGGASISGVYGMIARRHMHEFGTTSTQLAWVKHSASLHAQYNENAFIRRVISIDDVLDSPVIADPLHKLDCCVITDGGGAIVVTSRSIAATLRKPRVEVLGCGETINTSNGGSFSAVDTGALASGKDAFKEAGVTTRHIKYASIYDNFTIMVILQLEDLGFCKKGHGGAFVENGNLISGQGELPINTDGGGLCNNHPANRGGMTKIIEAVRQLRGEAHPAVQIEGCDIALASGPGKVFGSVHAHSTVILSRA